MDKPEVSRLLKEFILYAMRNPRVGKGRSLTVDQLKEEVAIWREQCEARKEAAWKPEELDQIEAELTALHLADDALLSEII